MAVRLVQKNVMFEAFCTPQKMWVMEAATTKGHIGEELVLRSCVLLGRGFLEVGPSGRVLGVHPRSVHCRFNITLKTVKSHVHHSRNGHHSVQYNVTIVR